MIKNLLDKFQEKSPKERFLLVIGILFFSIYLFLGLIIIFWESVFTSAFPLIMAFHYRIALGVLLIVYSFFRFFRFFNSDND
nr:hypothetical protein [Flavobacterium eburneipallidum]